MPSIRALYDRVVLEALNAAVTAAVSLHSFVTRRRMSHDNGITTRGRVRIVDAPEFPDHPFFRAGAEFPCRLRHASVSYQDDAALVVRGASLKFADSDYASPLDLLMNTGETAPFFDAWTFVQFMYLTVRGRDPYAIPYLNKYPLCARGIQVSLRRNPASFTQLYYYSKTPFEFRANDGRLRYVKFRLVPEDRGPETGQPSEEDVETPWDQKALPGETRSPNYLKRELRERLGQGPVRYHLQLQLHEPDAGDVRELLLNPCIGWDEQTHPWMDLAEVTLDEALPFEKGNWMRFSPTNQPEGMGFIEPLSIHDPPSLERLRQSGVWARRARLLSYRIFGMPGEPAEERTGETLTEEEEGPVAGHTGEAEVPPAATLGDGDGLAPQQVCTPGRDGDPGRSERRQQLEQARSEYGWRREAGLPPHVRELPEAEKFDDERDARMIWDIAATVANLGLGVLDTLLDRDGRAEIEDYDWLYEIREKPSVAQRFRRDDEFGNQRLAGVNPVLIRRCNRIPDHFPVTDELVAGLLAPNETLESARKEGRLYLSDYRPIGGTPVVPGRYLTVPLCLLYVNPRRRLVPIAIQLEQDPSAGPIFTPRDPPWLWLTVKTFVQCADAHFHEVTSHLLRTHLVMEPFAVATARRLSRRHPVNALLRPHFKDTMAINWGARTSMLAPGGPIDNTMSAGAAGCIELLKSAYAKWRFDEAVLETDLKARGVDDPDLLPGYHYRDDTLRVKGAIDEFVGGILERYYPTDIEVQADPELQGWARELVSPEGAEVRGLPGNGAIETRALLREILSEVIFTCTAEHASVNNGQYDMFGFPPNVPGAMYAPPPTTKQELDEETFVKMLPDRRPSAHQFGMVHLLSMPTDDPLGRYDRTFFLGDAQIHELAARFRLRLREISQQIQERNKGLEVPYTYVDPQQVAQSIAV